MNILICNVGSTSLKYQLFDMDAGEKVLASGGAERVGAAKSIFYHKDSASGSTIRREDVFPTHREAISAMLEQLLGDCISSLDEVSCVGFKVVHAKGVTGVQYLTEDVLQAMEPGDKPRRLPCTRKKDGSVSGDLADLRQFDLLKRYVFSVLSNMVDEIASGNVSPNPYMRGMNHNACRFCPYGAICNDQAEVCCRNYKTISQNEFWMYVEKEMSKGGR